ncbi:PREDICTED: tapasin isoform X2 [Galeopterus variegatus]|uniref:Tapasin isoform X2 n=1 Tax=Galeopterus variegatus TaxID=482537 RepID=A0ABM0RHG8_GALVR|nr:PREDICTED: tapasin isoform X2 [Galeopterus variegatus]
MKPLSLLLVVALGLVTAASAGPTVIECWFVEDAGGGRLAKRPAALLLRQGPEGPPSRPDLDPKLYLSLHDPAGALQAAFRRYPRGAPAPHCEMSRFFPLPASANWASGLTPEQSCPRALDGAWLMVSMSSSVFSLSSLLRPQPEPQQEPVLITMATVVLTVLTHTPAPRIRLGQDAMLDLSFAYMPTTPEATSSLAQGPPPFGLEWRRQHLEPPKVSLTPAPLVWAAPGEEPPELLCLVSHFYPSEGLEVQWELRGGPQGGSQNAGGQRWLSTLRHHSDGSVSLSGHLRPPPVTAEQHGARYVCHVYHPSLPASGRSAEVTLEVAGLSGPSLEDGIGLFLSAFLLLGFIKVLGWVAAYLSIRKDSKEKKAQ